MLALEQARRNAKRYYTSQRPIPNRSRPLAGIKQGKRLLSLPVSYDIVGRDRGVMLQPDSIAVGQGFLPNNNWSHWRGRRVDMGYTGRVDGNMGAGADMGRAVRAVTRRRKF